ncbi:MAG: carbonic anhydrase [Arcticibacterium sp.]|jgi:carbonic anhydrase
MGVNPKESFVHRNKTNMVPYTDLSLILVIPYVVDHLKVNHIVVCGYYYYGGVKAAIESADFRILNP